MTAIVEAYGDRIIVTGETPESVREATRGLFVRVSAAYCDFTSPVRQANGAFVATGHVRLAESQS